MDTYGHLLPDQHADAIGGMVNMLADRTALAATGTTGKSADAPAVAMPDGALECESVRAIDESLGIRPTLEFLRPSEGDKVKNKAEIKWAHSDSNREPRDYESPALPLSYRPEL